MVGLIWIKIATMFHVQAGSVDKAKWKNWEDSGEGPLHILSCDSIIFTHMREYDWAVLERCPGLGLEGDHRAFWSAERP